MHFRPFSLKKIRFFWRFRRFLRFFTDFFHDLLNIGLFPPETPDSSRVPHCRFILKIGKKSDFRCRPPKNGFQILNLHPKKHIFKRNTLFLMYFCLIPTNFPKMLSFFENGFLQYPEKTRHQLNIQLFVPYTLRNGISFQKERILIRVVK